MDRERTLNPAEMHAILKLKRRTLFRDKKLNKTVNRSRKGMNLPKDLDNYGRRKSSVDNCNVSKRGILRIVFNSSSVAR